MVVAIAPIPYSEKRSSFITQQDTKKTASQQPIFVKASPATSSKQYKISYKSLIFLDATTPSEAWIKNISQSVAY